MVNTSKRKGSRFEDDVVRYLRTGGFPEAERRVQGGSKDRGDIAGIAATILECKARDRHRLWETMDETERERENGRMPWAVSILKRPRKPVAEAAVVMTLEQFTYVWNRLLNGGV